MAYPRAYNAATDFIARNLDAGRAEKPAFVDPTRTLTYGGLALGANRMGNLLATYGIAREARIALMLHDTVDFPVAFWGAIKAGVVPVPLNTLLTSEQYAYMLADMRAKAVFISAALLPLLQPLLNRLPDLKHIFVANGAAPPYALSFGDELAQQSATFEAADTCGDEVAFWLYSSGSTGAPKGARHVHTSLMETARLVGQSAIGVREDDVVYSAAKLFFAYGLGNAMSFPMAVGATTILRPERPTPDLVFETLKANRATLFFGVPTLYAAMLASPLCHRTSVSEQLRLCVSAGEALPEEVGKAFTHIFGVEILDGVGSTEMLHQYVINAPGAVRYGTSGRAVKGYEIRLVDERGQDTADGEVGEMLVRGATSADGYWNQREKSRATFEGGWTRSGDKYVRDADGYYTYQGRTDDMFKVSGIWVSPFEVESALASHASVLEAAVVPRQDADGLLKPRAFVVLKPGQSAPPEAALQEHVKSKAGPWKYPRWIEFVDGLPKTATGKIQRYKLREG